MTARTKPRAKPRGALVDVSCACCGRVFAARKADRQRGWARACGKSCAARLRERRGLPMPRPVPGLDPHAGELDTSGPEFDFEGDLTDGHV